MSQRQSPLTEEQVRTLWTIAEDLIGCKLPCRRPGSMSQYFNRALVECHEATRSFSTMTLSLEEYAALLCSFDVCSTLNPQCWWVDVTVKGIIVSCDAVYSSSVATHDTMMEYLSVLVNIMLEDYSEEELGVWYILDTTIKPMSRQDVSLSTRGVSLGGERAMHPLFYTLLTIYMRDKNIDESHLPNATAAMYRTTCRAVRGAIKDALLRR